MPLPAAIWRFLEDFANTIQSSWYLTNIFTGFEIWRGALNIESTSFCAQVN